jgi:general secretion pathway protein D
MFQHIRLRSPLAAALVGLVFAGPALGQAEPAPAGGEKPSGPTPVGPAVNPAKAPESVPPPIAGARGGIDINYVDANLMELLEYFARATGRNFVLQDTKELANKKITIIANGKVSPEAAYEAFLSALEVHGLTTVRVGDMYKIIKSGDAQQSPGTINEGGDIRATDNYVTQIITLQNVAVGDVRTIIDNLISPNAKVLAYAPTNSLILTDSGNNIRRIYKLVTELDVAAPRSSMEIYQVVFADAAELKELIEELYGTVEDSASSSSSTRGKAASRTTPTRARRDEAAAAAPQEGVTAGKESRYITKVLSDERTNALIVIANEQGHESVKELIKKIDVDVDPTSRSQIYVYHLEHAKAEDVSKVLQDLSQDKSKAGGKAGDLTNPNARVSAARAKETGGSEGSSSESSGETQGAAAAFDSGMRIAADENTNSLVIIASKDDYTVIESVIRQLDTRRKQVYLDCVIVELSSQDRSTFDIAYHTPFTAGGETTGLVAGQFGTNSLGLSTDSLSGFSFGVFGKSISIPIIDPLSGTTTSLDVPAFGIALSALKQNQMVNIVSSPSLLAMDNEEAKIVVGRKIPFPTSNGLNNLGQPVISFQREDVAITLEVTPRVNSENFVTLELKVEVQEIEDNQAQGQNLVQQGGYITSNREVETVALVADNQTMVLGGLVGSTDSESESKIPILGDLPLIGALFRNRSKTIRRTNLMVFLTPHIIDDEEDMAEVMRVKEAQRQEFMRRFYGKSEDEQMQELQRLLQYSMNRVDRPSVFRGPAAVSSTVTLDGEPISAEARGDVEAQSQGARSLVPGEGAGQVPPGETDVELPEDGSQGGGGN